MQTSPCCGARTCATTSAGSTVSISISLFISASYDSRFKLPLRNPFQYLCANLVFRSGSNSEESRIPEQFPYVLTRSTFAIHRKDCDRSGRVEHARDGLNVDVVQSSRGNYEDVAASVE